MAGSGTLHDAFIDEVREAYDAEQQLTKALAGMAQAAASPELRAAFESHLEETRGRIDRLERVFEALGEKAIGKHCCGIAGIIREGRWVIGKQVDEPTMDARLLASGQRARHYQIAAYATLVAWAREIGHAEVGDLLGQILTEEKEGGEKLAQLARGGINRRAAGTVGAAGMGREWRERVVIPA